MKRDFRGMRRRARAALMVEALERRELMAVFTVTSALSTGAGTLREAIDLANADGAADTIQFAANVKSIKLSTELPVITAPLTIDGPGSAKLKINGGNKDYRIFTFDDGLGGDFNCTVEGVTLTGGKPNGNGGAIFNAEDLGLVDVVITKNKSSFRGGAVYSGDGSLGILNCVISSNSATENGGGIYVNGGTLDINSSTITGNKAVRGGGVWCDVGNLEIGETTISKNSATHSGGGVHFGGTGSFTLIDSTLSSNTAQVDGGGLLSSTSGPTSIENSTVASNKATDFGGGVFHSGGELSIFNSTFRQNAGLNGGGFASDGAEVDIDDFTFEKNTAKEDGGAVFYNGAGAIDINGGNFISNSAGNDGGAIWLDGVGASSWIDFTMVTNKAKSHGGGVRMEASGNILVREGVIRGNTAGTEGGAMFVQSTNMTWRELTVTGNSAKFEGGALFWNGFQGEEIDIHDTEFESNSALEGGAIFNRAGEVIVDTSAFHKNSAKGDGGAISNRDVLEVAAASFASNKASKKGGAIFNRDDGEATIRNSTISLNTAGGGGGGVMNNAGIMRIDSNIISGNKRGGAVSDVLIATVALDQLSSNNLIGDANFTGLAGNTDNIIGQNPLLLPFGDYGGLTRTFAITLASPALNAGNNLQNLTTDQRGTGFDREVDGATDIGAYEHEWAGTYARQLSVLNKAPGTYTDDETNEVKVTHAGNGSTQFYFTTLNAEDPALIQIFNTDAKSKVTVASPDGLTNLGEIIVYESIGEIGAAKAQLSDDVHIFGTASKLTFSDAQSDSTILIDGAGKTGKSAVAIVLGYVGEMTLTSAIPISLLQVVRWDDDGGPADVITAPRIDKLVATGQKNIDPGDFEANLEVTGAGQDLNKPVLGSVTIAGDLFSAAWDIGGSIGTMTAGAVVDSLIEVADDFKSLTVKAPGGGAGEVFVNSNVVVLGDMTTVKLGKVQTDNSGNAGTDFGFLALAYGKVEYVDASDIKITINAAFPPPQQDGDFFVDFVV